MDILRGNEGNLYDAASMNGLGSSKAKQVLDRLVDRSTDTQDFTANLILQVENLSAENERLKRSNESLIEQVKELSGRLPIGDSKRQSEAFYNEEALSMPETVTTDARLPDIANLLGALRESSVHVSYCNADLRYVWVTHFLKGFTWKDMNGKLDEEIFPIETKGLEEFMFLKRKALESGNCQTDYVAIDIPDHGNMTWLVAAKPCFGEDKVPVGVLTTCVNITQAGSNSQMSARDRATEYELREAIRLTEEAIRAKNMFLSIMSHEIRTPLNGLLGLAEALKSSELNKEQRELLTAIVSSGTIIADILGDILDLASMESGAMQLEAQPFSPAQVVQEVVKMAVAATHEKGLDISSQVGSNVPEMVIGDGLRVRQVMKYLVLNAIKFTQQGSVQIRLDSKPVVELSGETQSVEGTIETGDNYPDEASTRPEVKDESPENVCTVMLSCQIIDTGVGIPEEAFATLFHHFSQVNSTTTRNHGGTGLGLALCKQLVELMGGQLTVVSEVGKGSDFTFSVLCKSHDRIHSPCGLGIGKKKPMDHDLNHPQLQSTPNRKEPRILLAEDNKVNVMVAISMLKRLGFTAQVVANGVEALEAIRKEKYDLVLLDICMPLMDGLQVAYAIRTFEQTGKWPEGIWDEFSNAAGSRVSCDTTDHAELSSALEDLRNESRVQRIPIIAVTANALRSDIERCFAHGMDAFIPKPVMFQKLREILEKYLPIQQ